MTYLKPKDVTYTEMCIYIDTHIYETYDESLVFEYLYHILYMLAKKGRLFKSNDDYDKFALFGASRLFLRLTNPKQFNNEKGSLPRIKSILNYAKNVLNPLRIDYQQEEYSQQFSHEVNKDELNYNFESLIYNTMSGLDFCDFELTMLDIDKTCKRFLKTIPYIPGSLEWVNIYTSVMLTMLDRFTLSNKSLERITHLESNERLLDYHIDNFYQEQSRSKPVLFHLPEHMSNYIDVLCQQLKNLIARDLSDILRTKVSADYALSQYVVDNFVEEYIERDEYTD